MALPLEATAQGLFALGDRLLVVLGRWRIDGTFERLDAALRERVRSRRLGKNPLPGGLSAGIADSQSSKRAPESALNSEDTTGTTRRFEAGSDTSWWTPRAWSPRKRCTARKSQRPGRTEAPTGGRRGVGLSRLSHLWLDAGGYEGRGREGGRKEVMGLSVQIVRSSHPRARTGGGSEAVG